MVCKKKETFFRRKYSGRTNESCGFKGREKGEYEEFRHDVHTAINSFIGLNQMKIHQKVDEASSKKDVKKVLFLGPLTAEERNHGFHGRV